MRIPSNRPGFNGKNEIPTEPLEVVGRWAWSPRKIRISSCLPKRHATASASWPWHNTHGWREDEDEVFWYRDDEHICTYFWLGSIYEDAVCIYIYDSIIIYILCLNDVYLQV